jgi:HEAT repeat protein
LGLIGEKKAVPYLLGGLVDSDKYVVRMTVRALGMLKDQQAIPRLLETILDNSPDVRAASAWALGELKNPLAYPALTQALIDDDKSVREESTLALGKIGDKEFIVEISSMLHDKEIKVRLAAVRALNLLPETTGAPGLIKGLDSREMPVRLLSALLLGKMRFPEAIPILFEFLYIPRRMFSDVHWLLEDELKEENRNYEHEIDFDFIIIRTLGQMGGDEIRSRFLTMLLDVEHSWDASLGLSFLGDALALPPIRVALKNPDERIRTAAVHALWSLDDAKVLQDLRLALKDEDENVRRTAAKLMETKRLVQAIPDLLVAIEDRGWMVRKSVIQALGRIGDPIAFPVIIKELKEGLDRFELEAAVEAVGLLISKVREPDDLHEAVNVLSRYLDKDISAGLDVLKLLQSIVASLTVIEAEKYILDDPVLASMQSRK